MAKLIRTVTVPNLDITQEAPGALPNGTRVIKIRSEDGDLHAIGACGTIRGSLGPATEDIKTRLKTKSNYGYIIEWDDMPGVRIGTMEDKIQPLAEGTA